MMDKYAIFPGKNPFGSPHIHLVEPGSNYGLNKTASLEKTASREHLPEVQELLESIAPQPGRLYLVNSALGAGEFVGFNLRGDWFTEAGLTREPPGWKDIPVWDIDARRQAANITTNLGQWGDLTWGYPTFYNAHRFRHHVNKDPNKAYGFILGAFWDDRMKRVILVSELVEDMCRQLGAIDLYQRIQNGEFPDSSMGSKVPYDRCSICGNKARNPAQYCEHVGAQAMAPYGMKNLLPDGRRCGVYNDYPRFFDDSFVFVGAERSAKVMANVTDQLSGSNTYNQTIYPFTPPPIIKLANARDAVITEAQQSDPTLDSRIEIAVRQLPVASPPEKAAVRYYADMLRAGQKVKDGQLSSEEFIHMNIVLQQNFLRLNGVPVDSFAHIKDQLMAAIRNLVNAPKTMEQHSKAASFNKWAELFKEIPTNSRYMSMARAQTAGMRPLPDQAIEMAQQNPNQMLGEMARMGVVATPDEFMRIMTPHLPDPVANIVRVRRITFAPQPLEDSNLSRPFPIPSQVSSLLKSVLGGVLENRSFSPSAVRIRITINPADDEESSEETSTPFTPTSHPVLDEIGRLYNSYRYGLLNNIHNVDKMVVKLASFSDIDKEETLSVDAHGVSKLLFSCGYWPSVENII